MSTLRSRLVRVAYANPDLRKEAFDLLATLTEIRRLPSKDEMTNAVVSRLATRSIRIDKRALASLTGTILYILKAKIPNREQPIGSKQWLREFHTVRSADGQDIPIKVIVRSRPSRGGTTTFVLGGGTGKLTATGETVVVVELNGSVPGSVYRRSMGSGVLHQQILGLLVHEMTHVADPQRGRSAPEGMGGEIPLDSEMDLAAYYNQPGEVRAYMQEVTHDLEGRFNHFGQIKKMFGPGEGFKILMNLSVVWLEVKDHLTERNRRLIIKAAWTAYQDWLKTQQPMPKPRN